MLYCKWKLAEHLLQHIRCHHRSLVQSPAPRRPFQPAAGRRLTAIGVAIGQRRVLKEAGMTLSAGWCAQA